MHPIIAFLQRVPHKLYAGLVQRPIDAVRRLIKNNQTHRKIRHLVQTREEIFIEVGAGQKFGQNGWVTIDVTEKTDIYWDLRFGIPFPDASVSRIYSSHFLEHLTFREGQAFLDECLRVLKPGGHFSICVPNARLYMEAYLDTSNRFWDIVEPVHAKTAYNHTTRIDFVNYIAYMDGQHKYMFDQENIVKILQAKGFKNARPRAFDPALDLQVRHFESIYAEAER